MDRDVSNILHRLSMEKMRNQVIWYREARGEPDPRAYDERLHEAEQRVIDGISAVKDNPGPDTQDAAAQEVRALLETAKDVYTTIGIKVGTELAEQQLRHEHHQEGHTAPEDTEDSPEDYCPYPSEDDFNVVHSKDFFERMGARVGLQSLGAYIRDGGTRRRLYQRSFQERINEAEHELEQTVKELTKDQDTADQVQEAISDYEMALIDVYFSLGMKAGARLNSLLMGGFDKDY